MDAMERDLIQRKQRRRKVEEYLFQSNENERVAYVKKLMFWSLYDTVRVFEWLGYEFELSTERVQNLVSATTAVYLTQWLGKDPGARDNLHHYLREQEAMERGVSIKDVPHPEGYKYANKKRGELEAIREHIERQAQAEHISTPTKAAQKEPHREYADELNYFDLWNIAMDIEGKLLPLKLLQDRKNMFETTNKRDRKNLVLEAYQSYHELFRSLLPEKEAESIYTPEQNRTYVITAMMLQEMERTYRIHAVGTLVRTWMQEAARLGKPNSAIWESEEIAEPFWYYWSRAAKTEVDLDFERFDVLQSERLFPYVSYDILHYKEETEYQFCKGEDPVYILEDQILERFMLVAACNLRQPSAMPSWEEKDYADARQFFETEYPIFQIYNQMMGENQRMWMEELEPSELAECCTAIKRCYRNFEEFGLQHAHNPEAPMRRAYQQTLKDCKKTSGKKESESA